MLERSAKARPRSSSQTIQVIAGLRWGGNPSIKTRSATYLSQKNMPDMNDCFEKRQHIGIRNVQGLKTKYDEISKEVEGSNLDIAVLTETKEKRYRK